MGERSGERQKKEGKKGTAATASGGIKALAQNPLAADIVAAALVATASALKDSRRARRTGDRSGRRNRQAVEGRGRGRGRALWDMALQIGRRSLEALTGDEMLLRARTSPRPSPKPNRRLRPKRNPPRNRKRNRPRSPGPPARRAAGRNGPQAHQRGDPSPTGRSTGGNLSPHRAFRRYDPASARNAPARARPREDDLPAIVEAPFGSRVKVYYNSDSHRFRIGKFLPLGMVFPLDFAFIPSTLAGDGDPFDLLILPEASLPVGSIVEVRYPRHPRGRAVQGQQEAAPQRPGHCSSRRKPTLRQGPAHRPAWPDLRRGTQHLLQHLQAPPRPDL